MAFPVLIALCIIAGLWLVAITLIVVKSYHRPADGKALVISTIGRGSRSLLGALTNPQGDSGRMRVARRRTFALPIISTVESIDVSPHTIEIVRRGREGLVFLDAPGVYYDFTARLTLAVCDDDVSILLVARVLGCAAAGDNQRLEKLFAAMVSQAVKGVAAVTHMAERDRLLARPKRVIKAIGKDLNGFRLVDLELEANRAGGTHRQGVFR